MHFTKRSYKRDLR